MKDKQITRVLMFYVEQHSRLEKWFPNKCCNFLKPTVQLPVLGANMLYFFPLRDWHAADFIFS